MSWDRSLLLIIADSKLRCERGIGGWVFGAFRWAIFRQKNVTLEKLVSFAAVFRFVTQHSSLGRGVAWRTAAKEIIDKWEFAFLWTYILHFFFWKTAGTKVWKFRQRNSPLCKILKFHSAYLHLHASALPGDNMLVTSGRDFALHQHLQKVKSRTQRGTEFF